MKYATPRKSPVGTASTASIKSAVGTVSTVTSGFKSIMARPFHCLIKEFKKKQLAILSTVMPQTAEPKKAAKTLKRNASNASVGSTKRRFLSRKSSVDSAAAAPREEKNDHAQQPSEKGKSKGKVAKAKAKAKVGKARTCHADANAGEQWCVDFGRYVEGAVMLMVESEVRRHYPAASAADLKARTEEAVHRCQTQVDSAFDCMLNSHGGTIINDAQLLTRMKERR